MSKVSLDVNKVSLDVKYTGDINNKTFTHLKSL